MAVGYLDWYGLKEYTSFGEKQLRDAMRSGELPYIKMGDKQNHAVRFKIEDVDAWMESHRVVRGGELDAGIHLQVHRRSGVSVVVLLHPHGGLRRQPERSNGGWQKNSSGLVASRTWNSPRSR
jgi:hypothetical protein